MGPKTKAEALRKLDTYTIKVGYPDHPRDYSKLVITDDDLVGDVRRAGAGDWAFYTGRFFGPVDRSDWLMTPQTNDAYNGSLRDIAFPAGILQAPDVRSGRRSRDQLRRDRRRDRSRTHAWFRRSGPQDRCGWRIARLVDKGRRRQVRGARKSAGRAIFRVRTDPGRARERRADDGREHRRSRRTDARARCLSRIAAWATRAASSTG